MGRDPDGDFSAKEFVVHEGMTGAVEIGLRLDSDVMCKLVVPEGPEGPLEEARKTGTAALKGRGLDSRSVPRTQNDVVPDASKKGDVISKDRVVAFVDGVEGKPGLGLAGEVDKGMRRHS